MQFVSFGFFGKSFFSNHSNIWEHFIYKLTNMKVLSVSINVQYSLAVILLEIPDGTIKFCKKFVYFSYSKYEWFVIQKRSPIITIQKKAVAHPISVIW